MTTQTKEKTATCACCHETIRRPDDGVWTHANGLIECDPNTSAVSDRATAFARKVFAETAARYPNDSDAMMRVSLTALVDAAANQMDTLRSDGERLAEIRAYLAEFRRSRLA